MAAMQAAPATATGWLVLAILVAGAVRCCRLIWQDRHARRAERDRARLHRDWTSPRPRPEQRS